MSATPEPPIVVSAPWAAWHLPSLQPLTMPTPDKTHLDALRLLDMLALTYLVLSSARLRTLAGSRSLRLLEACGRHSLERVEVLHGARVVPQADNRLAGR